MTTVHLTGSSAPAPLPAAAAEPPERRRRLGGVTGAEVGTLAAALLGSLALDWLLYERVLPFSGAQGFLGLWYLLFLGFNYALGVLQWPRPVVRERLVTLVAWSAGALLAFLIGAQLFFLALRGYHAAEHANFYTQTMARTSAVSPITSGGALHAVVGSLEQLGLATLFSVPLGIAAAVFMAEVGGRTARPVRTLIEAMTALPSIVAGLFVLGVVILTFGLQACGFAASLALTVMMMPIVTRAAEVVIRLVPGTLREASYALGGSQWRTVWNVVLPTARPGLATAVILGMARGVGETSPVLLTAGFTSGFNGNPFAGHQVSLPLYIWNCVRQPYPSMVARGFAAGLTLMTLVLVLFVTARLVGGRRPGELSRRQRRRLDRPQLRTPIRAGGGRGAAAGAAARSALSSGGTVMPWARLYRPVRPAPRATAEGGRGGGRSVALLLAFSLTLMALVLGSGGRAFAATTLNADGSSWAGPAIEKWRTDVAPQGITVNFSPNGSAAGRQQWENGQDDFTASDVPFRTQADNGVNQDGHSSGIGNAENPTYGYSYVPITAGGTAFMYNLQIGGKQITDLRLSPDNLVDIFTGKITYWDDPKITQSYGRTLPHLPITPVVRSDGSGATAQFSRWMEHTHQAEWDQYCSGVNGVSCGDYTEFYPTNGGRMIAQNGSDQVAHYIEQPSGLGAIGYDEYAFALTSHWPVVKVLNPAGYYTLPTASNVAVALTAAKIRGVDDNTSPNDPDYLQQNLDGVYGNNDPRSYPISSYSYVIVPRTGAALPPPPKFSTSKGAALSQYLDYVLCGGQATGTSGIDSIGYSPIPRGLVRGGLLQVQHIPGYAGNVDPNSLNNCPNPTFDSSGNLIVLKNAPQPDPCDHVGQPLSCKPGNPGATAGGSGGSGSGGSGGKGGTGTGGTGGSGGGGGTGGTKGAGGNGGSGSGTPGGGGGGTGGSGGTVDPLTGQLIPGSGGGAAGDQGAADPGGSGGTVDPQTGQLVPGSGGGGSGSSDVAANVVNVGGRPQNWTLTTITAVELLAVVAVPPFLGGWLRRRRAGAGSAGGPR
ncbi:substrate-binding domain-containing protein [Kitasatospora sp. LaBMicrA B282]|uniref:substrate-binding domain-containing protein n=1 Tax=Kitasatospora sp. LaBMicrA B282 TaxID=3420949 RepID=UPI003D11C623